MHYTSEKVLKTYVSLTILSTFATSFIWGVNTLFLLDAGLSITAAFAANAFFTVGQVLFEVPTGIVADTWGRRTSYLLGCATLLVSTFLYLLLWRWQSPFWAWAIVSMLLGLGFTFFSGATEAWLVDALNYTKFKGGLESAFAKGQVAFGVAMLSGTVIGGAAAQFTNLGVPYILRMVALVLTFTIAFVLMRDIGFKPKPHQSVTKEMHGIWQASLKHGFHNPAVRWIMLSAPFTAGVSYYGFYALQPYLLELYGKSESYAIAGLAAALIAGVQIMGGMIVGKLHKYFKYRTSLIFFVVLASSILLALIGLISNFWVVLVLLAIWGTMFAISMPVRQAYINGLIPSEQRATVLSSDNMITSIGAAGLQPSLGKTADMWSYGTSFVMSGLVHLLALPFVILARRENAPSDTAEKELTSGPTLVN